MDKPNLIRKGIISRFKHKYAVIENPDDRQTANNCLDDIWGIGNWIDDTCVVIAKARYKKQPAWGELEQLLSERLGYPVKLRYV